MIHPCKKCLLLEAGEHNAYQTVHDYIANLSSDLKVDDNTYRHRLELCKACTYLISGMCRKCGCYVEVRAVLRDKACPDFDNPQW